MKEKRRLKTPGQICDISKNVYIFGINENIRKVRKIVKKERHKSKVPLVTRVKTCDYTVFGYYSTALPAYFIHCASVQL